MQTVIFSNPNANPSTSAVNYLPLGCSTPWQTSESLAKCPISQAGTISNLTVKALTTITTGTYDIFFRKGGVTQSLGGQLNSTTQSFTSTSSFTVAAGDQINLICTPTSTPTSTALVISWTFDSTTAGKSVVFACITFGTTAVFITPCAGASGAPETNHLAPMPTGGTFDDIYIYASTAPGAGNSRTVTLRKAQADTTLTATVTTTTTANATSSVSVAQGDLMTIAETVAGTLSNATVNVCLTWTPTTDGQGITMASSNGTVSASADVYVPMAGHTHGSTDTSFFSIMPVAATFKRLEAYASVTPGTTPSRTFTLLKGTASPLSATALTVQMNNTNPTSITTDVAASAGDYVQTLEHPANTPTAAVLGISYVITTGAAPPPTNKGFAGMLMGMVG